MKYVIVSRFDPERTRELASKVSPEAFAAIDQATKSGTTLDQSQIEALGVESGMAAILADHLSHLTRLTSRGELLSGGPCVGFEEAINIFEAETEQQARELHDADPLAKSGIFAIDKVYAWQQVF